MNCLIKNGRQNTSVRKLSNLIKGHPNHRILEPFGQIKKQRLRRPCKIQLSMSKTTLTEILNN